MSDQPNRTSNDPLLATGGTSLRVYLYLLQANRPMGIRELQRSMGFKSPTTARHHLERLVELGLVERKLNGYIALKPKGILGELFVHTGKVFPRSLFLSSFLVSSTIGCIFTGLCGIVGDALLSVASIISLYDSYVHYRVLKELFSEKERG
ncbi:MAG: LexA family transcriptional regulator [Desulfurococcales archaeon]|nr:LexA family transcriptional regulator [Desulfurococcales archaeon]